MSTILEIPVRNDLDAYSLVIDLDGTNYRLGFAYNLRCDRWFMSISGTDGTQMLAGIPILTNCDLGTRFKSAALPPGMFLAFDESGNNANAGRNDLGDNVKLLYRAATF